ncbi:MAG: hypothetical protein VX660_01205 [Candidatus Thermoplasmatota archaeon]|jgi:hypothetical protein|nr:hypothetical protein [Euryarchaeota archaeon]MEC7100596.1 hypothetical protein [Candidatus Thermoplasmatota archaeon]MEC7406757.1 hypothetical protein [Candidatus Thermoplasmatota archaeon]MEC7410279.1 hypothetical protein [Candidatus Thermoplasmatota archaeon]MEC9136063.1 hypothetical protein [Candidatus Thermoplasmatota archaeon]|tara:strand:- start:142 stop:735 length:594 start_codon:yes stop_codon:yes gene_type:complete
MDEQPQDEVPASGTLEGTTTNAPQQNVQNAFGQNVVYVRQKSQIPKVFGALMMIYGVIVGLIGILGVFATGGVISDYENAGIEISGLQTAWFYISAIGSGLIVSGAVAYGGYETFNYKRRGVMIGLGAVAFGFVLSLGDTAITGDIVQQFLDSTGEAEVEGLGALVAGVGVVMSIVCSAICGLLVAIPLLASGNDLE